MPDQSSGQHSAGECHVSLPALFPRAPRPPQLPSNWMFIGQRHWTLRYAWTAATGARLHHTPAGCRCGLVNTRVKGGEGDMQLPPPPLRIEC
jgi:hypothetical protein